MRILYIHQHFSAGSGSGGTRSYEIARHLTQRGHEVTVLAGRADFSGLEWARAFLWQSFRMDGMKVIQFNVPYSNRFPFYRRILAFLAFAFFASLHVCLGRKYDLVYASSTPLTVGIPALLARFLRGTPYIFEVRDLWPDVPVEMGIIKNRLLAWLLARFRDAVYLRASRVVALSPDMRKAILGQTRGRVRVSTIYNMSNTRLFNPGEPSQELLASLGLADRFVCIYTGTMGMVNGLDGLLETMRIIEDDGQNGVSLLVMGQGMFFDELEKKAAGLGNVRIMKPVPKDALGPYLNCADLCLDWIDASWKILSLNSANKFYDYLAAGRPVLINYDGWKARFLERWGCGLAIRSGDPRDVARAIISLKERRQMLDAMGKKARQAAERVFNSDIMLRRMEEIVRLGLAKASR